MSNCVVIIPALNPPDSLINYVKTLLLRGVREVIVINDGSKEEFSYIFTELITINGCKVITHKQNRGKGRALKTGFNFCLENRPNIKGVVTADADGQHDVEDVLNLADHLESNEEFILGVRDFKQENVPFRSLVGNRLTSFLFYLLSRKKIRDTQTGLRAIPSKQLSNMVVLMGERYEYEINMLIYAVKANIAIKELPIATLYFNDNAGSHYHSIVDSVRVFNHLISGFLSERIR